MKKPFFVMIYNQRGTCAIPMTNEGGDVEFFESEETAMAVCRSHPMCDAFGFDIFEMGMGVCGICNGLSRPVPPQKPGTHKWQHEDTGRCVDFKAGENPGRRWHRISDT